MFEQVALAALCAVGLCRPENTVRVSQDTDGNYDLQYDLEGSSKREVSKNGIVTGSYSYVDSNGLLQTVQYTAGPDTGFVILDSSNQPAPVYIPLAPVQYTPEVAAARAKHLELYEAELRKKF